jgi:uncharacterized membrane protein YagU involved in acid resistance
MAVPGTLGAAFRLPPLRGNANERQGRPRKARVCGMTWRGDRRLGNRLLTGALAGIGGTIAMTAALRRLEPRLSAPERYPMPPREIIQQVLPPGTERKLTEARRQDLTMAAHFGYGALTGALLAIRREPPSLAAGAAYGFAVWAASYLGWLPAARILEPATRHPSRRNWIIVAVHLIWGATTAAVLNELRRADRQLFRKGPPEDAPQRTQ